ncbi:MAG: apolipoprotein N-acyltransferase [Rickettsiales bacterium]|jgi:apolipoprotein N-acyltransferase|nr:apolipoprotein N-acyltransferase [Rickettsiales bacterium]
MKVVANYNDNRWRKYKIDFARIARMAASSMRKDSEVSIILTNDVEVRALNKRYRGINKATNVLSFETGDDQLLGDIFISFDTVSREAMGDGKTFQDHAAHMVVHGMLHLLGYDHMNDSDADTMENLEIKILRKLGVSNPYEQIKGTRNGNKEPAFAKATAGRRERGMGHNTKFPVPCSCSLFLFLIPILCGAVAALGYAPFNLWWATLLGIGGMYYLVVKGTGTRNPPSPRLRRAGRNSAQCKVSHSLFPFLFPYLFGAAYAVGMFWWVVNSIFVVPELAAQFAIFAAPAILGIGLFGGLIFEIPFVVIRCMRPNHAYRAILFALLWTVILWLREWLLTGFPWNPVANISMPFPILSNSMSLWGAMGLTFVIIGLVASIVEIIRNVKSKGAYVQLIIFSVLMSVGIFFGYKNIQSSKFETDEKTPVIRIVQPASSAEDKATHSREQAIANAEKNIQNLIRLATENPIKPDLYVFPETAYPYMVVDGYFPLAQVLKTPTIMGAMSYDDGRFYNSLLIANPAGRIEKIYSKSHLVPFGEYRPLGDIIPTPGQLTPGAGPEILQVAAGDKAAIDFAPAICYEIIFSDSLVPGGAPVEPDVIVNITNDTWFGKTPGSYQHLDMVRRYAIESGLPVVRANYSGISAFIDSDGRVASRLPIGVAGYLDGRIGGGHMTIYRRIGRDLWMVIILLFSATAAGCISLFQKRD